METQSLVYASVAVLIFGTWLLSRVLPWSIAVILVAVRVAIPFIYFSWYYDASWNFLDDLTYYNGSANLIAQGFTPAELLFTSDGRGMLTTATGSRHILYYIWNVLAMTTFGVNYYSAVFLNIVASLASCVLFSQILRMLRFGESYRQWALILHVLHWEYLSWTSLINSKDNLVELLILCVLFSVALLHRHRSLYALPILAVSIWLLSMIRFYIPCIMLVAIGLWLCVQVRYWAYYVLLPAAILCLVGYLPIFQQFAEFMRLHNLVFGAFRFLLMPRPWMLRPETSFLFIPSIFQWLFAIPTVVGATLLFLRSFECRLPMCVLIVFVVFYAVYIIDPSPRMRIQATALFAFAQFHFLWTSYHWLSSVKKHSQCRVDRTTASVGDLICVGSLAASMRQVAI